MRKIYDRKVMWYNYIIFSNLGLCFFCLPETVFFTSSFLLRISVAFRISNKDTAMPLLPFVPKTDNDVFKSATQSTTAQLAVGEPDPNLSSGIAHDRPPITPLHPYHPGSLHGWTNLETGYRPAQSEGGLGGHGRHRLSSPATDLARRLQYAATEYNSRSLPIRARGVANRDCLARLEGQAFAPARTLSVEWAPATPASLLGINRSGGVSIDRMRHAARSPPPLSHISSSERLRNDSIAVESDNDGDNSEESDGSMPSLESGFGWEQSMDDGRRVIHIEHRSRSPVPLEQGQEIERQPSQASPNVPTIPGAPSGWLGPVPDPTEAIQRLRDDPAEDLHVTYAPGTAFPVSSSRRLQMPATPRLEGRSGLPLHWAENNRTSSHELSRADALALTQISEPAMPERLVTEPRMSTMSRPLQPPGLSRAAAGQEVRLANQAILREVEGRRLR